MTRPSRVREADRVPADDTAEPALTTPARLARRLEALANDVARAGVRLRLLSGYVDHAGFPAAAAELAAVAGAVTDLAAGVAVGRVAITAGRDDLAGQARYPLFHPIEAGPPPAARKRPRGGPKPAEGGAP